MPGGGGTVPLPLRFGSATQQALKRGEYRSFTYRLPAHVPELKLSIMCETGSVCLFASNCSQRPNPRNCQWSILVDAQKNKLGSFSVRTSEHHFIGGMYHVGIYCVSDSTHSVGCFPLNPSKIEVANAAAWQRYQAAPPSPRPQGRRAPMAVKKPFVDAGLLENLCVARGILGGPLADGPARQSVSAGARPYESEAPRRITTYNRPQSSRATSRSAVSTSPRFSDSSPAWRSHQQ